MVAGVGGGREPREGGWCCCFVVELVCGVWRLACMGATELDVDRVEQMKERVSTDV